MTIRFQIFLIFLLIFATRNKFAISSPTGGAILRQVALKHVGADTSHVGNLTRQHDGDIFDTYGVVKCNTDICVGLSSGTAGILKNGIKEFDISSKLENGMENCKCQCLPHLTTYRDDVGICVDDIHECTLAPFISGSSAEKIPFVFLPLRGQIIHPSREISFPGIQTPICAVTGSQFLTQTGWTELRNPIDTDVPFRLFRDEGRTFLQWLGEADLRYKMQGRLILVHLLCRDMAHISIENVMLTKNRTGGSDSGGAVTEDNDLLPNQNIFTPCVAFRVVGTPIKHVNNVTEVSFQSESSTVTSSNEGLTTREYIVIGICSLLLGLIYVASVLLYLHMKKRKNQNSTSPSAVNTLKTGDDFPQNDQVTFGSGFNRNESASGYGSKSHSSTRGSRNGGNDSQRQSGHRNLHGGNMNGEELGIIKNNPLLKHYPNLSDNSGFLSDQSNSNSEFDDDNQMDLDNSSNTQASVVVHPSSSGRCRINENDGMMSETSMSSSQDTECLPEENVSIVEDMSAEDKLENMKAIVNGTIRRKLYFNPAYFEPHLLASPPPAALEFLNKIREVISIAKYKMAAKKYQPSLNGIPEEYQVSSELYGRSAPPSSRRSSILSLKRENSRRKADCSGCPGCETTAAKQSSAPVENSNCKNCGDKRNSIRKWLEGVSTEVNNEEQISDCEKRDKGSNETENQENQVHNTGTVGPIVVMKNNLKHTNSDSSSSSDSDTIKANSIKSKSTKGKAPPIPSTAPKIVSHSLKSEGKNLEQENSIRKTDINPITKNSYKDELYNSQNKNKLIDPLPPADERIYDKMDLYNHISQTGSEIYNNPQFQHGSPELPVRNMHPPRHGQNLRGPKRQIEVLDQYANPVPKPEIDQHHYEMFRHMPDMVYEALANDYNKRNHKNRDISSSPYSTFKLPTPDYNDDETPYGSMSFKGKNNFRNYSGQNSLELHPQVPTPDYNTYGRSKNGSNYKHYQPDSPIYTRKSPHYLIVDYETDSLERVSHESKGEISTPPSNSDSSSHPSPSLSTALPLEEEVEIRNAVYDKVEGFRKDGIGLAKYRNRKNSKNGLEFIKNGNNNKVNYSLVSEVYIPNAQKKNIHRNGPRSSKIKYNVPYAGSMTIELDHSPTEYDVSTDSDQFEPDTLDRKPKKLNNFSNHSNNKNISPNEITAWNNHLMKSVEFLNRDDKVRYSSLENMTSLPDLNQNEQLNQLVLRTTGSFKSDSFSHSSDLGSFLNKSLNNQKSFGSLREIYEAKNQKNLNRPALTSIDFIAMEKGRLLTLEAKHSKRQRKINDDSLKKAQPPDVVPCDNHNSLYDKPKAPIKISQSLMMAKNLTAWNNDEFINRTSAQPCEDTYGHDTDTCETTSTNSESTEFTGVSDTVANSEFELDRKILANNLEFLQNNASKEYSTVNKLSKFYESNDIITENNGCYINEMEGNTPFGILENFMTLGAVNNKHFQVENNFMNTENESLNSIMSDQQNYSDNKDSEEQKPEDDIDKIEVISTKSVSTQSNSQPSTIKLRKFTTDISNFEPVNNLTSAKIFRVEINTSSNGMAIALGLKDRVKKTKDIKNAWKRFVSMATSKFGSNKTDVKIDSDCLEKISVISDSLDKDEGISSLIDEKINLEYSSNSGNKTSLVKMNSNSSCVLMQSSSSSSGSKLDADSGYISADSNESKLYSKKFYERFNFKEIEDKINEASYIDVDVVEKETSEQYDCLRERTQINKIILEITDENMKDNFSSEKEDLYKNNGNMSNNYSAENKNGITNTVEINVYSSDDNEDDGEEEDRYSSSLSSEETEDEYNVDDVCESGAESVETHSVLFRQIRKIN